MVEEAARGSIAGASAFIGSDPAGDRAGTRWSQLRRIPGLVLGEHLGNGPPLERLPEPAAAMDASDQVEAFDRAMAAVRPLYRRVARQVAALVPRGGTVLDLGCGSGHLLEELLALRPDCLAIAVDLSSAMLARTHARLTAAGLCDRCLFLREDMTTPLPIRPEAVVSLFAAHHLPDAVLLRRFLAALAGYAAEGAAVVLWDLARPRQAASIPAFREAFHPGCGPCFARDVEHSLRAAWSRAEVQAACRAAGLAARVASPVVVPLVPLWWNLVLPATRGRDLNSCRSCDR